MSDLPNSDFAGLMFVKGHGTENDFILYADPDGALPMDAEVAAWLADRRTGIGADGVIRAVRTTAAGEIVANLGVDAFDADWFMDYRNADGSIAEMCGNGARVFVEFLRAAGLADIPDGRSILIATRGGVRRVWCEGANYAVDLGAWTFPGGSAAAERGGDVEVSIPGGGAHRGVRVNVPNPHVVVRVQPHELAALNLTSPPTLAPEAPDGANIEFIAVEPVPTMLAVDGRSLREGRITMRVWERGVGETRSCGTGMTAAAIVASLGMADPPSRWRVQAPGGRVWVRFAAPSASLPTDDAGPHAILVGPALLVHQGALIPYVPEA
ncbi:MAG: diaminopimelate epimerase [Bifidobacteriaceae bacterium]|nr:diaminopimelate epimerase [Bifidobacteriaceae bacterium]